MTAPPHTIRPTGLPSVEEILGALRTYRSAVGLLALPSFRPDTFEGASTGLNRTLSEVDEVLRRRFGHKAAALEGSDDRKREHGGWALVYWQGLFVATAQLRLQPLRSAPLHVRMRAALMLDDLLHQLQDEE